MPSILKLIRDLCCCSRSTKDPSDAVFAAGFKAWRKYEERRESQYLAVAVRNYQAALDIRVPDHPRRPESLSHTAMARWAQCQGSVTKENSSTVIAYYDAALRLLHDQPNELGHRAIIYTNLGTVYFTLFRLEKRIRTLLLLLALTSTKRSKIIDLRFNLGRRKTIHIVQSLSLTSAMLLSKKTEKMTWRMPSLTFAKL